MKKTITFVEVSIINLDENDILTTSNLGFLGGEDIQDPDIFQAPSRYNYRGMATDWESEDE